jgi:hypothetical protein
VSEAQYEKVLRDAADEFVMTVSVVAERSGEPRSVVLERALADAAARLVERGVLGEDEDGSDE